MGAAAVGAGRGELIRLWLLRHGDGLATLFWLAAIPVVLLTDLRNSVPFLQFISLYAIVVSHWGAFRGARAEHAASSTEEPVMPTPKQPITESSPPPGPSVEPGSSTSEFKLAVAVGAAITAAVGVFDACALTGVIHVDPSVVIEVDKFGATLVTLITIGYGAARGIRKQGS